jgi:parallel beta-helix repeat protein
LVTRRVRASVSAALVGLVLVGSPAAGAAAADSTDDTGLFSGLEALAVDRDPYGGDPEAEAAYVAAEDDRLVEVRTVDSLAAWSEHPLDAPYRLATGSAYTLVLTARRDVYTVEDLLALAPQTFVRQPDGAYLLSEHLVIQSGATLNLTGTGGLRLLLASDADGFVSIVNSGGRLNVTGTTGAPVQISSFDRSAKGPDERTSDGRAYIRSIGGQVYITHAEISDLGFWSGRTGGLSLTGTDRPNSGSLDELGETLELGKQAERERAAIAAEQPVEPPEQGLDGNGRSTLSEVLPAGPLPVPLVDVANPQYSYVSASIAETTVTGNAFGIFVSGANGLDIRRSAFDHSLVDGLVMHRYVVNAVVEETSASDNGGDGMVLARATTGIVLSEVVADDNARNGISVSGMPLANGPSATGITVGSYGNNTVANSRVSDNGRYGVEVVGGINIGVLANDVAGNEMGVVVREGADKVSVVGNRVQESIRQGVALRDGVRRATVSGNIVSGGDTGIYVRDSDVDVKGNTLNDSKLHAVSLVGDVSGTMLVLNTISGRGASAIDAERASNVDRDGWDNNLSGWEDTTPFFVTLKRFLQPLTLMWIVLAALLVFTAVRGSRARRNKAHPYAHTAPVSDGRTRSRAELEAAGA